MNDPLIVFDSLEVGPVVVEPNRVTTTYTVRNGDEEESTKLVYRFEEDVFDEGSASRNLAAMMTAQVALNYGLFCRRLVFRGCFDEHDRRFLEAFAENTAREIRVNKFLMENPFLVGDFGDPPDPPRERHCNAEIVVESEGPEGVERWAPPAAPPRYAVLSSGGKDSLLSFGMLRELGCEVHPIFVNESGRHWYTALNGYRYLSAHHSTTARVWTNSDRVFAWMLRRLPFVRKDFANVRSDEYPIRLWTVAVFSFGVLPLLRKRGISRLLVGNEHDTTTRATHRGIVHYAALYDQSRIFDEEMTRYFQRKGWRIKQFSALRTLSELLVEKALAERYPELLRQQVSCHATHIDNDRVHPCGSCEKCRRIVGMLTAIGVDPGACGYSAEQITRCLDELVAKGVHQEVEGAEQLAWMLLEKGIGDEASKKFRPRPHPETLHLRFHPRRSPAHAIPEEIRPGVYRILLEHADGAVVRAGRTWEPFSLEETDMSGTKYLLGELTWPEAEARFRQVDVALLPVGAVEQHGPHLPLDTDAYDADYLARRVAEACSDPRPLVFPPVAYGVSYHHRDFSGTLSVSPETQARLIHEIGMSAAHCGIKKLVLINGHGGNAPALHLAAQMINRDAHIFTCVDTGETSDADVHEMVDTPNDVHAGEIETSTTLAIRPHLVDMTRAARAVPRFSSGYLDFTSKRSVGWYAYTSKISKTGVMGDATKATAEKGERIWEIMTKRLVELVEDLKRLSLEEIYQRRY